MEALAVGALGALALLAVSVRLIGAAARRILAGGRRAGRAGAAAARTLGARGLVAALAGGSATVASVGAAAASPAPTAASAPALPLPSAHAVAHAASAPSTYVVRPGDSLWGIAERHLGPHASNAEIAAEWPRWYRANRGVIGSDPSLIHVGARLVVPHPRRTGTSASTHHRPAHRDPGRSALTLDPDRR